MSRHRLRRHWLFTTAVTLAGAALSVAARAVTSGYDLMDILLGPFAIVPVHRSTVLTLALLVLAGGWLARGWWRTPAMRTAGVAAAATAAFAAMVAATQLYYLGKTVYFLDKMLYVLIPVLLVALGGAAPAIARLLPTRRRTKLAAAAIALAMAAIPLAAFDAFEPYADTAAKEATYGRGYLVGAFGNYPAARLAVRGYQALGSSGPPRPMLFYTDIRSQGLSSMWASALQRDQGLTWDTYLWSLYDWKRGDATQLQQYLLDHPTPGLQLVASDSAFLAAMRRFAAAHPQLALTIVEVPAT